MNLIEEMVILVLLESLNIKERLGKKRLSWEKNLSLVQRQIEVGVLKWIGRRVLVEIEVSRWIEKIHL